MRALFFFLAMLTISSSLRRIDASDPLPVLKGLQREGGDSFQDSDERRPKDGKTENDARVKNQSKTRNLFKEADERRSKDEGAAMDVKVQDRRPFLPPLPPNTEKKIECAETSYSRYPCYRGYRYGCSPHWLVHNKCWKSTKKGSDWYWFAKENENEYVHCDWNENCLAHWKALEAKEPLDQPCDYDTLNVYPCRYGRRYGCDKNVSPHKCWLTRYQNDDEKMYVKDRLEKSCLTDEDCDPVQFRTRWRWRSRNIECGKRKVDQDLTSLEERRIAGGINAVRGSLPWQVTIRTRKDHSPFTSHICGGTIIDRKWILTARHCLEFENLGTRIRTPLNASDLMVKAGKIDRIYREDGEQNVLVEEIFRYPNEEFEKSIDDIVRQLRPHAIPNTLEEELYDFVRWFYTYDIALLKLAKELHFDNYAQPACLPSPANEDADYALGSRVIISGWGADGDRPDSSFTRFLKVATLPIINHTSCEVVRTRRFCAANWAIGGVDTCIGDSGGPVIKKVGDRFTVLGVVKGGTGPCGHPNASSVNIKVTYYVDWIKQTVQDNDYFDFFSYYMNRQDQEANVMID